jgi:GTP-binding protein
MNKGGRAAHSGSNRDPMIIRSAKFTTSGGKPAEFPNDGWPQIAFAGRSNVGKSSLINSLVQLKKLAYTSRTPGRTQRVNFFAINDAFYFVDLPGYGYARTPRAIQEQWGPMIESYLEGNKALRCAFVLIDARREPSDFDLQLIDYLRVNDVPIRIVATKFDKLSPNQRSKQMAAIRKQLEAGGVSQDPLPFSVLTREGRDTLLKEIAGMLSASSRG